MRQIGKAAGQGLMVILTAILAASALLVGCKLHQQEPVAQQKIDDSDTRKTVEQQKQEKTGSPGTKLFNITRLLDKDGDTRIAIPIAISMEIKNETFSTKLAR